MENTIRNKQKFFALYYGQDIFEQGDEKTGYSKHLFPVDGNLWGRINLTPLSAISDEDAIEVAKIVYKNPEVNGRQYHTVFNGHSFVQRVGIKMSFTCSSGIDNVIAAIDYLRSKGYALPYMGLSVEELVNRGWITLKTS